MIAIVDYGVGNLGSIINIFKRIGVNAYLVDDRAGIENAERILLPGVGAFDTAIEKLEQKKLIDPLNEFALEKRKPVLGICLGMQIIGHSSEEGNKKGLGWIDGESVKFSFPQQSNVKVPNMGWGYVSPAGQPFLTDHMSEEERFYFVHSYHFKCSKNENVMLKAYYGGVEYTAGIINGNIAAVQFHPEKSHRFGKNLLKKFSVWQPKV